MILITDKAVQEIKRIQAKEAANAIKAAPSSEGAQGEDGPADRHSMLRVMVVGGGCSGMSYKLGFDDKPAAPTDKIFEKEGVKVVCDPKSFLYLTGTELDFSDGLNGTGFVFNNPNAKRTCGCGSSFSA